MKNERFKRRLTSVVCALIFALTSAAAAGAAETTAASGADGGETTSATASTTTAVQPEAPVLSYENYIDVSKVSMTINAPSHNPLGLFDSISYRIDDGEWESYRTPVVITENCTFSAKIVRVAGEESPTVTVEITNIDNTPPLPPEIVADDVTWVKDSLPVSITSASDVNVLEDGTTEPGGSGWARTEYRLGEEGEWHEYTGDFTVSAPVTLYARSVDKAGNCSEAVSKVLKNFDITPPDCTAVAFQITCGSTPVQVETGTFARYYKDKVTVAVEGARDSESGVAFMEYQAVGANGSLTDTGWTKYDEQAKPVISGDFCGYVYVRAVDKVGNVSTYVTSEGIVIDVTAPTISNIKLSTTAPTDSRVTVTFAAEDNVMLETVTVNGQYVGIYDPTFTAFRNGDYVIEALDKAGNKSKQTVKITNINASAFNLMAMYNSLVPENFTPSTWAVAQTAASELQGLLTVESGEDTIAAASEKLVLSLERLVVRGDGTASLRLIEKVNDYDSEQYTDTSWARVTKGIKAINECLAEPERTQEDVDIVRRNLENAITELVNRGDFTNLDRLVAQCEALTPSSYDAVKFDQMMEVVAQAKALSRTDTSQTQVDETYRLLLDRMSALKIIDGEEEESRFTVVMIVIIALLIITICTLLFVVSRKLKAERDDSPDGSLLESDNESEESLEDNAEEDSAFGDFVFTDDDTEQEDEDSDEYIGRR